jgi:3-oxoacyl-[acyl-carrier protein] reductase
MDFGIAGRKALVCGGSRGLGYACGLELAKEGCELTLVARDAAALAAAAQQLRAETGRTAQVLVADLSRADERERVLRACPDTDILVTNAGGPPGGDFRQLTDEQWQAALQTNFLSAVHLIRALLDGMAARGFGRVVNITSMTVRTAVRHLELSNATRLALTGYVAGVARQVAPTRVTINNLLPGTIATERIRQLGDTAQKLVDKVPMGRAGTPEEFGATCAFLCSRQAAFITGQNVLVDGGLCDFTV